MRRAHGELCAEPRGRLGHGSCSPGSILSDWSGESVNRIVQSTESVVLTYGRLGLELPSAVPHAVEVCEDLTPSGEPAAAGR